MSYTVSTADDESIVLNENAYVNSVLQNVRMLLSTWEGDVPLYRDYGLNPELLHRPINVVESLLIEDISEKIEKYEPRCTLISCSFTADKSRPDVLGITVEIEVDEDE